MFSSRRARRERRVFFKKLVCVTLSLVEVNSKHWARILGRNFFLSQSTQGAQSFFCTGLSLDTFLMQESWVGISPLAEHAGSAESFFCTGLEVWKLEVWTLGGWGSSGGMLGGLGGCVLLGLD